jgi:hypothetical protein
VQVLTSIGKGKTKAAAKDAVGTRRLSHLATGLKGRPPRMDHLVLKILRLFRK